MTQSSQQSSSLRVRKPGTSAKNLYDNDPAARKKGMENIQALLATTEFSLEAIEKRSGHSRKIIIEAQNGRLKSFSDLEGFAACFVADPLTLLIEDVARRVTRPFNR